MNQKTIFPLLIIFLSLAVGIWLYPSLPETMVTHWDALGQPNGFSSKNFAVFFMPALSVLLYFLFLYLPKTDPYQKNFQQFKGYFYGFINLVFVFLFYIYLLSLVYNLGYPVNIVRLMSPALAALFYYAGILMSHAKRNWFVGIRTPWTLSSDLVWSKTHILGARLFKLTALISLLGILFPSIAIFLTIIPILATTFILFTYSYLIYRHQPLK